MYHFKASISTIPKKCASNPELDVYIKKPKFSRDSFDYDVSREGYSARKLVCDEKSDSRPLVQTIYWVDECEDVPGKIKNDTIIDQFFRKFFSHQKNYIENLALKQKMDNFLNM